MEGLPEREEGTTRLRISAKAISDTKVEVEIRDMGFGEIAPSSGRTFSHIIELKEEA